MGYDLLFRATLAPLVHSLETLGKIKINQNWKMCHLLTSGDLTFDLTLKMTDHILMLFDELSNAACCVSLATLGVELRRVGCSSEAPSLPQ